MKMTKEEIAQKIDRIPIRWSFPKAPNQSSSEATATQGEEAEARGPLEKTSEEPQSEGDTHYVEDSNTQVIGDAARVIGGNCNSPKSLNTDEEEFLLSSLDTLYSSIETVERLLVR